MNNKPKAVTPHAVDKMAEVLQQRINKVHLLQDNKKKPSTATEEMSMDAEVAGLTMETGEAGFSCLICHVLCKSYTAYLDHLHSRKHLNAVGKTTKIEKASSDSITAKLDILNQPKEPELKSNWETEEELIRAEKRRKKEEKKNRKLIKQEQTADDDYATGDLAEMPGFDFTSFGKKTK